MVHALSIVVPVQDNVVMTAHDAFPGLSKDYFWVVVFNMARASSCLTCHQRAWGPSVRQRRKVRHALESPHKIYDAVSRELTYLLLYIITRTITLRYRFCSSRSHGLRVASHLHCLGTTYRSRLSFYLLSIQMCQGEKTVTF